MKKFIFLLLCCLIFIPSVYAKRGCCSHHGGVSGCSSNGRTICNDGTLSPTCTCTAPAPKYIYGCTDKEAKNYDAKANKSNNSCVYYIKGCTDSKAKNYNPKAEKDNGTCEYYVEGCMDSNAKNYNPKADKDNNSCLYYIEGCTDKNAENYNPNADKDDNRCEYLENKTQTMDNSANLKIENKNTNNKIDNVNNNGTEANIGYFIVIILMLFISSICSKTLIAKKIMHLNGKKKIVMIIIYFISVICPIIDINVLLYYCIKRLAIKINTSKV